MRGPSTPFFGALEGIGLLEILIILIIGILIAIWLVKARREGIKKGLSVAGGGAMASNISQQRDLPGSFVKRCPTCKAIYTDETLAFCLSDGSTLERVANASASSDPNATLVYPNTNQSEWPPTVKFHPDISSGNKG